MLQKKVAASFMTAFWLAGVLMLCTSPAQAGSSANYDIPVSVLDGGGGTAASANYALLTATAQAGEIGQAASTNYGFQYGHISQQYEALPPTVPAISVGPASPTTTSNLLCTVTTPTTVAPGLVARYRYSWSNGADTVVHGPTPSTTDTLSSAFTLKHQTWTCSVVGYDGSSFSPVAATGAVTVINTAPTAPGLSIAAILGDASNILCSVSAASFDPDLGDVVAYGFVWHVRRSGQSSFSVFGGAFNGADFSIVSASSTLPGDTWYCVATPTDSETVGTQATSAQCGIQAGGITPSYISLAATPLSVTLGEPVTALGDIFPVPGSSTIVSFASTSPSGVFNGNFPESVATGTNTYSRLFYPTEASEGRTAWSLTASWPGDATYTSATSASVTFTVLKAQPSLSLSLSASSAPLNYGELTATATLDAPVTGSLRSLLSGRTIKLWLKRPDGSAAGPVLGITAGDGRATFPASSFVSAGIAFNTPGTWKFQAEFEGDNNFKRVTSAGYDTPEAVRLTVKDRAGYAVIVVGKLDPDAEGLAEHSKTTDFVYRSFRDRGFAPEDIYYLREGTPPNDILVSDTSPTQNDVKSSIETWALAKMTAVPAPLYVVFVDHGSTGKFYLYSGIYGEGSYIDPAELSGYMTTLQSGLSAHGGDAGNQNIVFVYGGCHSGSFIPVVSGPHRIIVTSCGEDEVSNRGVVDPDGLRDGELFTTELFGRLRDGQSLKESFEEASTKTLEYTAPRSAGAGAEATQNPELDDNGDGVGGTGTLSADLAQDGGRSALIELGYGVNAGGSVGWTTVSQTVTLALGAVMPDLVGLVDQAPPGGSTAWIEIKSPVYTGGTLVDPLHPEDSQQTVDLTRVSAYVYDEMTGACTWRNLNTFFQTPGTYQVFYYITDGLTHETSSHMLTTVYRMQEGNRPPEAVSLLYPDNAATVPCTTFLAWEPTTDPDDDPVTYRLEAALDAGFTTGRVVKDAISATVTKMTVTDGLLDGQTYYWRVLPVDAYGLTPADNEVRTFTVNNQNTDVSTALYGVIRDSDTQAGIADVTVTVLSGPYMAISGPLGNYFVAVPAGMYSMSLSATGYTPQSRSGVSAMASVPLSLDFEMVSTNAPFRWGDVSGDGKVGTVDAAQILQWSVGLIDRFDCNPGIVYPQFPPLADVNGLNGVGTVDASLIVQKRVGLIPALPADHNGDGFGPDAKRLVVAKNKDNGTDKTVPRTINISTTLTAAPGATFDVPIMADDATGVLGYLLRIEYDAAVLDYVEVLPGALTSSWGAPTVNPTAGRVVFAGAGAVELTGSGALAVVRLKVKDAAQPGQSTALQIAEAKLNDGEIPARTGDGATIAIAIRGDIGQDGKVDAQDVQLVINGALGLSIGTLDADVDKSGRADAVDIQRVINAALGIQ